MLALRGLCHDESESGLKGREDDEKTTKANNDAIKNAMRMERDKSSAMQLQAGVVRAESGEAWHGNLQLRSCLPRGEAVAEHQHNPTVDNPTPTVCTRGCAKTYERKTYFSSAVVKPHKDTAVFQAIVNHLGPNSLSSCLLLPLYSSHINEPPVRG
jgi:hypothetical protein